MANQKPEAEIRTKRSKNQTGATHSVCRLLCLLLCLSVALSLMPGVITVGANDRGVPTGDDMIAQIKATYAEALSRTRLKSFNGSCAHYVNHQLVILGINTTYVSGNGNEEFDTYKNMTETSGGMKVHAYPAGSDGFADVLRDVVSAGNCVTNILCGFQWTSSSGGQKYGHVFFIHAYIDGYFYFSDSFSIQIGGVTYREGVPVKCTLEQLNKYYGRTEFFTFEGAIWFEDPELTAALNAENTDGTGTVTTASPEGTASPETTSPAEGTLPPEPPVTESPVTEPPVVESPKPGRYTITADGSRLYMRSGPGTTYGRITSLADGTGIIVTEVKNGWGHIVWAGNEGWISLEYATRSGELPDVIVNEFDTDGNVGGQSSYSSLSSAILSTSRSSGDAFEITVNRDIALDGDAEIPDGIAVVLGSHKISGSGRLIVAGGSVRAAGRVSMLDADPFVSYTTSSGEYTYRQNITPKITTAKLVIGDNVALCFNGTLGVAAPAGAEYELTCITPDGVERKYSPSDIGSGTVSFRTDGIPAKMMGDAVNATLTVRASSGGRVYERRSPEVTYSITQYVESSYGAGGNLDAMLSAMLNYGTAAQNYFGYNLSEPSNGVIPFDDRISTGDTTVAKRAKPAPTVTFDSTAHISSAQLLLADTVALRFKMSGAIPGAEYSLLVFTDAEYRALASSASGDPDGLSGVLTADNCSQILLPDADGVFTLYGIPAKKFTDTFYFRLCEKSGAAVSYDYVVSYSVTEYCAVKLGDGVREHLDTLCLALAEYSNAAIEYFAYTPDT